MWIHWLRDSGKDGRLVPFRLPVMAINNVAAQRKPRMLHASISTLSFSLTLFVRDTRRSRTLPFVSRNHPPRAFVRAMLSLFRISSSTAGRQASQTGGYRRCSDSLYSGRVSSRRSYSGFCSASIKLEQIKIYRSFGARSAAVNSLTGD